MSRIRRVVLTGGPGGGKTTAADLFRRELGERVVVVPEAATILFSGGFPRPIDGEGRRAVQTAIFHVQRNLEDVQSACFPDRLLLCDRGTLDGAAYWPTTPDDFLRELGTSWAAELGRYDAVVFFESAAVGGLGIEGGNRARVEGLKEAAALDARLREVWGRHPCFTLVPHSTSFFAKMAAGLEALQSVFSGASVPAAPRS